MGDLAIPGVPGTGAEIVMNWAATIGAKTGRLLPTGRAVDQIVLQTGARVQATFCDAGNACVWVPATELGRTGSELTEQINQDAGLIGIVREIRGKAAARMGLATDWSRVDEQSPGLPMAGLVARPEGYRTLSGGQAEDKQMDLRVRLLFMNRLHESIAGSASICLAAASQIPGSVVEAITAGRRPGELLIGHPSGITAAKVEAHSGPRGVTFDVLGFSRTARRLMDGTAYYPPLDQENAPRRTSQSTRRPQAMATGRPPGCPGAERAGSRRRCSSPHGPTPGCVTRPMSTGSTATTHGLPRWRPEDGSAPQRPEVVLAEAARPEAPGRAGRAGHRETGHRSSAALPAPVPGRGLDRAASGFFAHRAWADSSCGGPAMKALRNSVTVSFGGRA
jgi:PrpF protein